MQAGDYGGSPGYARPASGTPEYGTRGSGTPEWGGAGFAAPGPEPPGYGGYYRETRHGRDLRGAAPRPDAPR